MRPDDGPLAPMPAISPRARAALSVGIYLTPVALSLVIIALVRDMWPPFRQIAVMFFLGWLLAFLLAPIVDWLVARFPRLPRAPAVAVAFALVAGVAIIAMSIVGISFLDSVDQVVKQGPAVSRALTDGLASVQDWASQAGLTLNIGEMVDELVTGARSQVQETLPGALGGSLTVVTMATTVIFIAAVMVASKDDFLAFARRLIPREGHSLFDAVTLAIHRSFGGYLRGQFGLGFLYGLLVAALAVAFGVPFVPFIAITTALLQTIPFFGQLVSWIPLVLVAFVFEPDRTLPVVGFMAVGWLLLQNVVSPRVIGSAVGLNPLVVLFAVFAGGAVAGPLGAVFGVPLLAALAAVFVAWLDHARPAEAPPPRIEEASPDEDQVVTDGASIAPVAPGRVGSTGEVGIRRT